MEYESRRDADDAYHEMHNKRMGRDDLLKIEVILLLTLLLLGSSLPLILVGSYATICKLALRCWPSSGGPF